MTLVSGTRLGPYEILAPLGAGGMGEVYRARDGRLGREVAVKVLPAAVSSDPDRLKRFEKEARSASALNHPNIVTIHDIGESGGTSFIAMELVDGRTLRELLAEGALPTKRLLPIAAQVADGLAKAHGAGIVHRDLKPENVMVTKDGFVKILDFGLAKLTQPEDPSGATAAQTVSGGTEPGMVMGTIGYMSPEQALGKALDFRSDQFSFGSILYEMATGKRAFLRGSTPETLSAIIREEPEPIGSLVPSMPAPVRWVVERCLAKQPDDRYASTRDLARDLATVREHLSEASVSGVPVARGSGRFRVRILLPAIAALAACVMTGIFIGRRTGSSAPANFVPVTHRRGSIMSARFAPDGQTIVYGAAWDGKPTRLFAKRQDSPDEVAISLPNANILSISRSGEMAIALDCRIGTQNGICGGTLARAAITGGAPRAIADDILQADWAPDGENLAVTRMVGGRGRLEFPIGKVLYETSGYVSFPRLSPKADRIAFLDHPTPGDDRGFVAVVDLSGKKTSLTDEWYSAQGLVWSPSGEEIWFTAATVSNDLSLRAVTLSGKQRLVATYPGRVRIHDISRTGRALMTRDDERVEVFARSPGESRERDLTWLEWSIARDLSADGKTLLFDDQTLTSAVCLRGMDGSPVVRLGEGTSFGMSPDGKWVLALPPNNSALVLLPTGPGVRRALSTGDVRPTAAAWSPNGDSVVFAGAEAGHRARLYVLKLDGSRPRPFSPEGVIASYEERLAISPDSRFVAALGPERKSRLYPLDGGASREIAGTQEGESPLRWNGDGRWLYVNKPREVPIRVFRVELATGRRELWKELMPADSAGVNDTGPLALSADGESYAYTGGRLLSELYVVDGLR